MCVGSRQMACTSPTAVCRVCSACSSGPKRLHRSMTDHARFERCMPTMTN